MFHVKHRSPPVSEPLDAWKAWPVCPADECDETKDVTIMECAPGCTYMTVGGVCGHTVFLHRKPDTTMTDEEREVWAEYFRRADVPRETSGGAGE
jgi:uncharacterized phage-associated protein